MLIGFTVVVRIFAKPGKSDQRWLEKINLHCLSFWSFIISWNKWFSPTHVGHNYWYPFIKYFLQTPSEFSPIMLMCLENTWQEITFLHTESLQILQIHRSMLVLLLFSSANGRMVMAEASFCAQW